MCIQRYNILYFNNKNRKVIIIFMFIGLLLAAIYGCNTQTDKNRGLLNHLACNFLVSFLLISLHLLYKENPLNLLTINFPIQNHKYFSISPTVIKYLLSHVSVIILLLMRKSTSIQQKVWK